MLLDHADFALQEQAEDNLMVAFSWAWYNGSYTTAAKPIKSLELHYTMIQFLIIRNSCLLLLNIAGLCQRLPGHFSRFIDDSEKRKVAFI